jgi:hypothetical protein
MLRFAEKKTVIIVVNMKYCYRQEIALKSIGYGMKTKRLRKKLLKYPERYVICNNLSDLFKFEYTDIIIDIIPNHINILNSIPKSSMEIYHQPVIIPFDNSK